MSRKKNRNRGGSNSNVYTPPIKDDTVSETTNQSSAPVQLSAEALAALTGNSAQASHIQVEEALITNESDNEQSQDETQDEPETETTEEPPVINFAPQGSVHEPEPESSNEPEPTASVHEEEPETVAPVITKEGETKPEIFEVFAKQVLGYNGNDRKEAWQHFCMHVSGMIRYVSSEPDMQLVPQETLHLVKAQISL